MKNSDITQNETKWSGSITELSHSEGRVYVRLATPELAALFLQQAEAEGFTFSDGAKPTSREPAEIMAVNANHTINYVGTNGRIAYGAATTIGGEHLVRVCYST